MHWINHSPSQLAPKFTEADELSIFLREFFHKLSTFETAVTFISRKQKRLASSLVPVCGPISSRRPLPRPRGLEVPKAHIAESRHLENYEKDTKPFSCMLLLIHYS